MQKKKKKKNQLQKIIWKLFLVILHVRWGYLFSTNILCLSFIFSSVFLSLFSTLSFTYCLFLSSYLFSICFFACLLFSFFACLLPYYSFSFIFFVCVYVCVCVCVCVGVHVHGLLKRSNLDVSIPLWSLQNLRTIRIKADVRSLKKIKTNCLC